MNEFKIIVVQDHIGLDEVGKLAEESYGDYAKAVVDIEKKVLAIGGEMHVDAEQLLLEQGSHQRDLWGINIYPHKDRQEWIEFNLIINLRPRHGNRTRVVVRRRASLLPR